MGRLTQKQEIFCLKYFELGNATMAAKLAGYAPDFITTNVTKLLENTRIKAKLQELKELAGLTAPAVVMTVNDRKERLSEFGREDIEGKYGIQRQGNIQAISELNKMEKIYTEGATLNIDNRKVEIIVSSDTAKKLTEAILSGEGT